MTDTSLNPVPVNARLFLSHLLGDRGRVGEDRFWQSDLAVLRDAILRVMQKTGQDSGEVGYGDYDSTGRIALGIGEASPLDILRGSFFDPAYRLETSLGMARFRKDQAGDTIVEDEYNFGAPRALVEQKMKENTLAEHISKAAKSGGLLSILNLLGNVYGAHADETGNPVRINLGRIGQ